MFEKATCREYYLLNDRCQAVGGGDAESAQKSAEENVAFFFNVFYGQHYRHESGVIKDEKQR